MTPSTPSGRRLADWLDAMRRKQYLGVPMPSEVDAIEAEAGREAVEAMPNASMQIASYRLDLRTQIAAMIQEAGGLCVVPDDPENPICETHSELLFDGFCEDDPRELRAVFRLIEGEK